MSNIPIGEEQNRLHEAFECPCQICNVPLPADLALSMIASGYEPDSGDWLCTNCQYIHMK